MLFTASRTESLVPLRSHWPSTGTPGENIYRQSSTHASHLESCRYSLIHFQVLFCAIQSTGALLVQHLPCGEVPHAIVEADLAELVVIGHEVPEGLDLLHLCLLLGVHDIDQGLIL